MYDKSSQYKILIVDDDENLNILIKKILSSEGYQINTCTKGFEALIRIKQEKNLLILLDYKLPDIDAFEFIEHIPDPSLSHPFIIMTGLDDLKTAVRVMKAGAKDYLVKDANFIEILPSVIKRVLNELENKQKLLKTEKFLEASEYRYRRIIENIPLIIYRFLPVNYSITFFNDFYCKYFDFDKESLLGKSIFDFISSEDQEKVKINIDSLNKNNPILTHEYHINTSKGKRLIRWIDNAIFDNDKIIEYQSIGEDITDQRKTLEEFTITLTKYKELFTNMKSCVSVYKAENNGIDFKFLDFNKQAEIVEKIKREDVIGKSIQEVFPGVKDFGLLEVLKRVYKTGIPEEFPLSFYKDNRISGWRENYVYKLSSGEIVVIYEDVSEKKLAEQKIIESEKKLRDIMETVPVGILITDMDGNGIELNSKIVEMLKYDSKEKVLNTKAMDYYADTDDRKTFIEMLKKGNVANMEVKLKKKNGDVFWALVNSILRKKDDGSFEIISSLQDITDKKAEQEKARQKELQIIQTEKMASIGVLLSGIVHEINNPNNYILLNSSIIKDFCMQVEPVLESYFSKNSEITLYGMSYNEFIVEIKKIIDGLIEGSNKIKNIVQSLKEFIKPDLGRLDNNINVNKVVESSLLITNNIIKKSTNKFIVEYDDDIPLISGNLQQLEQVIINLIVNACEALPDRDKMIKVKTAYNKKNKNIIINIIDEGVGIPKKYLNKITEPFFTTKAEKGGTGLGLSISNNIIKKFNGELNFLSEIGKGTTVTIVIPVNK
jgi:PAS domain S-box-containing protein